MNAEKGLGREVERGESQKRVSEGWWEKDRGLVVFNEKHETRGDCW